MKRFNKFIAVSSTLIICTFFIFSIFVYAFRYRINSSHSIPKGVYKIVDGNATKGDYAIFCPPDTDIIKLGKSRGYIPIGSCPGGYQPLMKLVAGVVGDTVDIGVDGVKVNGVMLPLSKPLNHDSAGRELHFIEISDYRLQGNEYLMMTDSILNSFDARYFGIVRVNNLTKIERVF